MTKPAEIRVGRRSRAAAAGTEVKVELTKPVKKTQALKGPDGVSRCSIRLQLIGGGKGGDQKVRLDLYDGSEQGDKIYDTGVFDRHGDPEGR